MFNSSDATPFHEQPSSSVTTDRPLALLYLKGPASDVDLSTTRLIAEVSKHVRITTVATAQEATTSALKAARENGAFHGLLLSPALTEDAVLQIVTTFRKDHVPVAIVPVVTETHRGLCTKAVAAGADTVLLLLDGALVSPVEALDRVWRSPHRLPDPAHHDTNGAATVGAGRRALEKLQSLFKGSRSETNETPSETNGSELPGEEGRVRLRALLNNAHVSRVRIESVLGLEQPQEAPVSEAAQPAPEPPAQPFVERRKKGDRRKDAITKAQLDQALEEAFEARKELRDALDAHSRDRSLWETLRDELQAQLDGLRVAATAHTALGATLADVRVELQTAADRHAQERADWEATRLRLEAGHHARDASTTGRADLQAALDHLRRQLQEATTRLTSERAAWGAARQKLEGRLADLTTAAHEKEQLDAALKAAHERLQKAIDAQTREQSASKASRQGLEAKIRELEASAGRRGQLEEELERARRERQEAADVLASERAQWEAARRALEADRDARVQDLQASAQANARLEALVNDTQGELERVLAAHRSESSTWADVKGSLDAKLAGLDAKLAALEAAKQDLEHTLEATRAELTEGGAMHAAAESARDAERRQFERDLAALRTDLRCATDNCAVARDTLASVRQEQEQISLDAATVERERQRLEDELSTLRATHMRLGAAQQALEAELHETTSHARRLSEESSALRAELDALTAANDRAELEERLRQARRVEEVGHLAAAMAPELETLLHAVGDHGSRLLQQPGHSDSDRHDIEAIQSSSEQARRLLHQLVAFSRRQSRPLPVICVNEVVQRAEPMLARLCGAEIDFALRLGTGDAVEVLEEDLEQLVTTLVFSARELLTAAGSVVVETSLAETDEAGSGQKARPGGHVTGPRLRLTTVAAGYGVQPPQPSSSLELIVRRCGAELETDGVPGRTSILRTFLPIAAPR